MDKSERFKEWMKLDNTFCPLLFMHLHVNTKKDVLGCCRTPPIGNANDFDYNSDKYKELRHNSLNQIKNPECSYCYKMEEKKLISDRLEFLSNKEYRDLILNQVEKFENGEDLQPYYYDLRISNNCNLACIMCGVHISSTFAKDRGIETPHLSFEVDIPINPDASFIYLAGGEPFMIKKFVSFLEKVENKDCFIQVITNGTIITQPLLEKLKEFNNVSLTISIDAYGELNSKIRRHSIWEDIDKNIDIFKECGFNIIINTTVQKENVFHLQELADYLEKKGLKKWHLFSINDRPPMHWSLADGDIKILEDLYEHKFVKKNFLNAKFWKHVIKTMKEKNAGQ